MPFLFFHQQGPVFLKSRFLLCLVIFCVAASCYSPEADDSWMIAVELVYTGFLSNACLDFPIFCYARARRGGISFRGK